MLSIHIETEKIKDVADVAGVAGVVKGEAIMKVTPGNLTNIPDEL